MAVKGFTLAGRDDFEYTDPVDGSVAKKQGVRLSFGEGTRAVFRLSGTGSTGATIRMYLERYEADASKQDMPSAAALKPLADAALELARLVEFTGRDAPTVIT
jgi:phosphoglucomutase